MGKHDDYIYDGTLPDGMGINEAIEALPVDLTRKTNEELEDMLLDLCGRLELDDKQIELLKAVEEERERRFEEVKR